MPYSAPNFQQIEELIVMRPFRPFAVETNGGSRYVVQSPDHIKWRPADASLAVIFHDRLISFFAEDDIKTFALEA
jgi:hypothetical protein